MEGHRIIAREPFIPKGLQRTPTILLVDDDKTICKLLEHHFKGSDCNLLVAHDGYQALEIVNSHSLIDLVILDLRLPGMSGLETLREINKTDRVTSVIVMTAYGTMEDAILALKEGAYDFVNKSASFDDLRMAVRHALQTIGLQEEVDHLRTRLEEHEDEFSEIIGNSEGINQVMKLVRKVRDSDITVLIQGESGSGKEMIARAIHYNSKLHHKPFVALNCAAIPENLLESELFGHVRGAFTGATNRRIGRFEEADEGTIFLDEIGEMGGALQAKLLRVLQTKEIQPIGGHSKKVNVRIISATNQDLGHLVVNEKFRQDLYYRLAVFPINLPPLKERREDIPILIDHFVEKFSQQEGKLIDGVSPEVSSMLEEKDWPGNVRELENMIYRAIVLTESRMLQLEDFPVFSISRPLNLQKPPPIPPAPIINNREKAQEKALSLDETEAEAIQNALKICGGNISKSADLLKIGRATLYRKLKKYGINPHNQ